MMDGRGLIHVLSDFGYKVTAVPTIPALNDSRQNFILASKTVKEMYHQRKSGHRISHGRGQKHKPPILPHTYHPRNTQQYPSNQHLPAHWCHDAIARNVPKLALPRGWLQVETDPLVTTSQNHSCSKFSAFRPLTTTSPVSQYCTHQRPICVYMKYALGEMALDAF